MVEDQESSRGNVVALVAIAEEEEALIGMLDFRVVEASQGSISSKITIAFLDLVRVGGSDFADEGNNGALEVERDLHVEIAHTVKHGMELEFWGLFELWVWNEIGICLCEQRGIECFLGYTTCLCACALLSCEVKWVLGRKVCGYGLLEFSFCFVYWSSLSFFCLFYLIYGG